MMVLRMVMVDSGDGGDSGGDAGSICAVGDFGNESG